VLVAQPRKPIHGGAICEVTSRAEPAQKCANDLRAFDGELQKGGYWLHNSSYGYGYPMYDYMYDERGVMLPNNPSTAANGLPARPGYEIRTLVLVHCGNFHGSKFSPALPRAANNFADYHLRVGGLVEKPSEFS
jgi:hypothetical protein